MDQTIPSKKNSRLEGLDLARYLAFVGMVIVNFKVTMGVDAGGGLLSSLTTALEGRAAATFVVLAGVGLGLAAAKGISQTITVTIRRALFLLVIGLLNMLVFDADIIHYYAFYFFFGAMLLGLGNRSLAAAVIALNIVFVIMVFTLNYDKGWNWETLTYSGFWTPTGFIRNLFFNGWHPVIPWLGFLLLGIIVSRLQLAEKTTQVRLVAWGIGAYLAAQGTSYLLTLAAAGDPELTPLVGTAPVPPMPLYMLAGSGMACAVIGLCLLVSERLKRWNILHLLVPAGRQTLTLYVAHILLGMGTLEALGMLQDQTLTTSVSSALLFCVIVTIYAWFWSRRFKRGPIEALMRATAG